VVGWSMGGLQTFEWAALYPEMVGRMAPLCSAARCSRHNYVFLEGMKAALTADQNWQGGLYDEPPTAGLRTIGRAWASWALSQAFYNKELYRKLGHATVDDYLRDYWEAMFLDRDANNMLSMIWTWQRADISVNDIYNGAFEHALGAITAKSFVMPGETDLYFQASDSAYEVDHMPNAELRQIPSLYGHLAAGGKDPADTKFINETLKELLAR
jgi:homoserine O-acetyltransferase